MPTYLGGTKNNKEAQPVSILKQGASQSKRKGTPTDCGNKAARLQGTSPMTRDAEKDNELDVLPLEVMEIDGKKVASSKNDDQDSIARAISSVRKELFASASSRKLSLSNKPWRPITPKDTSMQDAVASRSATFAAKTVFHQRSSTRTDGDKTSPKTN
jgi:hypothetical protein